MDLATGMMMTAVALFQEAESPLGHLPIFDPPNMGTPAGGEAPQDMYAGQRQGIANSLRQAYGAFENDQAQRGDQRTALYARLRKLAGRYEQERTFEGRSDGNASD